LPQAEFQVATWSPLGDWEEEQAAPAWAAAIAGRTIDRLLTAAAILALLAPPELV
jgi:hypothetical protein